MTKSGSSVFSTMAAPLACVMLLACIVAENSTHFRPRDAEPYHARAKAAIEAMPFRFDGWTGRKLDVDPAAERLLHPNCILNRAYTDGRYTANLLIVQCKDGRDMAGHYPPNCYPAQGEQLTSARDFELPVVGQGHHEIVKGVEYRFIKTTGLAVNERYVYDFFIVPGKGFVRDMADIRQSAKDYQRRYLGAAQFQVVFSDPPAQMSPQQREEIVATLLGANAGVFEVLNMVGTP